MKFKKELGLNIRSVREIHRIRPYLLLLLLGKAVVSALFPFINIYMTAVVVDGIVRKESFRRLLIYVILTVVLNAVCTLIVNGLNYFAGTAQSEFEQRYNMRLADKAMKMDFADVENPETFNKRQKIIEMRTVNGGGLWKLLTTLPDFIGRIVTIAVSLSLTFHLFFMHGGGTNTLYRIVCSPLGSGIVMALMLGSVAVSMHTNAGLTKKIYTIMEGIIPFNRMFGYYQDNYFSSYHAGKDIRLYNQKGMIQGELASSFTEAMDTLEQLGKTQFRFKSLGTLAAAVSNIAVYLFVGLRAMAGLCSVGQIVLYINSINQFIGGIGGFMTQLVELRTNGEALDAYFAYMEIPSHRSGGHTKIAKDTNPAQGKKIAVIPAGAGTANAKDTGGELLIEFRDVTFRYPGTARDVIRHVSFTVPFGKRTAIVGMNGSGKTTMIKLLCRLYEPQEGEILLGGVDIRDYDLEVYTRMFGVVFQEYRLLSFGLGQNIAADVDFDWKRAEQALKTAGFSDRLAKMPQGLETALYKDFDEGGVELSGGEAQKIAIARALYRDAPFIILDEPTAALDPIAEAGIYADFARMVRNRTAIYISHRLSSCRFCDNILVFDDGRLIQEGTHEELVADRKSKYYELWQAQAQYYVS